MHAVAETQQKKDRKAHGRTGRVPLLAVLGLATLIPAAARAGQTCPSPTPVPPQVDPDSGKMCNPSACTPGFCTRGDIVPLGNQAATLPLQNRLVTLDCSHHSIAPVQVFAEAEHVPLQSAR